MVGNTGSFHSVPVVSRCWKEPTLWAQSSWTVLSLTYGQISGITVETWPPLSSCSRRFNSTCRFMLAAVIKFRAKAQPALRRFLDVPWLLITLSPPSSLFTIYHLVKLELEVKKADAFL